MKWHKYEHENRNYHFVHFCFPSLWKRYFTFQRVTPPDHSAFLSMLFLPSQASHVPNLSGGVCLYLPSCGPPVPVPLHWSASVLPVVCVVISYEGIAIFVFAVQDDHQRMVLHSLVAPLVCVLKPWLEEVETGSEAGQHQDRHQQVDGDEPVQEHPGHGTVMERYRRRKGDIRLWADDEIPNTIYLLYTWCSFTCKHTTYNLKWNTMCKYLPYQNSL